MLQSRVGFEIELLTPRGSTRADLARGIATAVGGRVERVFHPDSEPSAVQGMGSFRHLTPGFAVFDADEQPVCSVVDDVTVVADLDVRARPLPGWYRLLTDDARLLNLLAAVCDPEADQADVLTPVAELFGTEVRTGGRSVHRVADRDGASVAMAAPLPGERHRPAEIVTVPLERDHAGALDRLLEPAAELGATVPVEAAVHLHFDAAPFRSPTAFANVVDLFAHWRPALWRLFGTNPACRRLAAPPAALVELLPELRAMDTWAEVAAAVADTGLTKYADVNLVNVVRAPAVKDTLEVRILPGAATTGAIMARAVVTERLLRHCTTADEIPAPSGVLERDVAALGRWGKER